MPSLLVKLRLGQQFQMSERPRKRMDHSPRKTAGGGHSAAWTPAEDLRLLQLRRGNIDLTWPEFQERFYPGRTTWAITKRYSGLVKDEKEMFPALEPWLNGGANRPTRRTSTPQYVYSDQESDAESEYEASKSITRSSLRKKEDRIQTRATTKTVSVSNDAPKRKASTESGGEARPEPPKLARTASHPGLRSLSDVTPVTKTPTPTTNRGVSVDSTGGKVKMAPPPTTNGGASPNGHQLPGKSLSSASKLDQTLDTDFLFILHQAKKCSSETKRAGNLAVREREANEALRRCREENEQMMKTLKEEHEEMIKTLKTEHEEELKKTTEGLEKLIAELHDAKEKQSGPCEKCSSSSTSSSNTTSTPAIKKMEPDPFQKLVEQVAQVKEAFTKVKTGSKMIINPEFWKSHGMEAAAALGETTLDEINEALEKLQKGGEA
ncbi:hypothetical protein FQN55_008456 [Onygenales sp. PD_40]|nr:hypothetical protein FQN55_008456 [Onygenales sp. PD_40]